MTRIAHDDPVPEALRGAIIALGNFDGYHLGHQRVVGEAIAWARVFFFYGYGEKRDLQDGKFLSGARNAIGMACTEHSNGEHNQG